MGKKTIIALTVMLLVIITSIWLFASIYNTARSQYNEGHQHSKEIALEKGKLTSIDTIDTYNGNIKYHIISGKNVNKEPVYAWIPLSKEQIKDNSDLDEVVIKKQSSGITKEEAVQAVKSEYNVKQLINVKLGMDEEIPIWEVKYKDQSDRYTFDFVHFSNGEIVKHMAVKNDKFK